MSTDKQGPKVTFLKREVTECRPVQPSKADRERLNELLNRQAPDKSK